MYESSAWSSASGAFHTLTWSRLECSRALCNKNVYVLQKGTFHLGLGVIQRLENMAVRNSRKIKLEKKKIAHTARPRRTNAAAPYWRREEFGLQLEPAMQDIFHAELVLLHSSCGVAELLVDILSRLSGVRSARR
jgi:hypothetical protein